MTHLVARPPLRRHVRHYLEMLAAMVVGMLVAAHLWEPDRVDLAAAWTATGMAVGTAVWTWHRGHPGAAIAEMAAAAYAPYLLLLVPWWAGLLPGEAVLVGGHLLMLPAMAVPLLRHPGGHEPRTTGWPSRWPTALALLCTVDNLVRPVPLAPWTILVLPLGYLLIGALRGTLRPVLRVQLAALACYLLLVAAAHVWGPLVVGLGWLAHGAWDRWHHRRDAVVPRPYAEWCGVVDVVIGVSVVAYVLAG
jgi:hypothetical protein